jgi:beta-glucosidase
MTDTFPPGFLWGAATSAHQTEGNNVASDLWAVENRPGSPMRERSGDACDSLHRWSEDLDLVAGLGLTAYRFSIEWARIEPARGRFSGRGTRPLTSTRLACTPGCGRWPERSPTT